MWGQLWHLRARALSTPTCGVFRGEMSHLEGLRKKHSHGPCCCQGPAVQTAMEPEVILYLLQTQSVVWYYSIPSLAGK